MAKGLPSINRFMALWLLGGFAVIVLLAVLTAVVSENHSWWGYLGLVNAGVTSRAVIVRTDPPNHCLGEYSFVVDGRSYSNRDTDCQAHVGQEVAITYLHSNPQESCLGSARSGLVNELMVFFAVAAIVPPFTIMAFAQRRRGESPVA